jgi:hypothetical protein
MVAERLRPFQRGLGSIRSLSAVYLGVEMRAGSWADSLGAELRGPRSCPRHDSHEFPLARSQMLRPRVIAANPRPRCRAIQKWIDRSLGDRDSLSECSRANADFGRQPAIR